MMNDTTSNTTDEDDSDTEMNENKSNNNNEISSDENNNKSAAILPDMEGFHMDFLTPKLTGLNNNKNSPNPLGDMMNNNNKNDGTASEKNFEIFSGLSTTSGSLNGSKKPNLMTAHGGVMTANNNNKTSKVFVKKKF